MHTEYKTLLENIFSENNVENRSNKIIGKTNEASQISWDVLLYNVNCVVNCLDCIIVFMLKIAL